MDTLPLLDVMGFHIWFKFRANYKFTAEVAEEIHHMLREFYLP